MKNITCSSATVAIGYYISNTPNLKMKFLYEYIEVITADFLRLTSSQTHL